ncbi:bifunctional 5,10-methylenetetrahydrofolate dehydrogenase/5,10-methenyltetrahydrofolate cyclohydrolase [Peptoniphilus catoniae]|uniref:bifunctional 5,10-methylenetetrahydrofolate dehydrogenase/5,10-methenyltetrahydrofolate cyclohydrolase n=1 Tax=Peptoniphilus catoniae TaxID=1660341 RepID=UPI0010FEDD43|nr:bifunctional 5,10-methylenetetrahydrofolate dehydrogenase/5,10-methenyltetrahydrofolate cyclohydrolase [Peptoniphilus catoniae]
MTKILESKSLYEKLIEDVKKEIKNLGITPKLAIVRLGEDAPALAYEKGIKKTASLLGFDLNINELDIKASEEEVLSLIDKLNNDDTVGGILIFRPLPQHIDPDKINNAINPLKDIDCMNPVNRAKVYSGNIDGFIPLAPKSAVMLLEHHGYDLKGKDCVIINHSDVVGKPLSMILLAKWATVSLCHIETKDLRSYTKNADIVFTAMGVPEMLDDSYFSEKATVIDIGLSKNKEGKMCGDLNEKSVEGKIEAYSPVPGGVGRTTNLLLLQGALNFYKK